MKEMSPKHGVPKTRDRQIMRPELEKSPIIPARQKMTFGKEGGYVNGHSRPEIDSLSILAGAFSPYNPAVAQCSQTPLQGIFRAGTRIRTTLSQSTRPLTISLANGRRPHLPPNPVSPSRSQNISSGLSPCLKNSDFIRSPLSVDKPTISTHPLEHLPASRANLAHTPQSLSKSKTGPVEPPKSPSLPSQPFEAPILK